MVGKKKKNTGTFMIRIIMSPESLQFAVSFGNLFSYDKIFPDRGLFWVFFLSPFLWFLDAVSLLFMGYVL